MNENLISYILKHQAEYTRDFIDNELLRMGYQPAQIAQAWHVLSPIISKPIFPPNRPISKSWPLKRTVLMILLVLDLALIGLVFNNPHSIGGISSTVLPFGKDHIEISDAPNDTPNWHLTQNSTSVINRQGQVYKLDIGNYQVLKFDNKGQLLNKWGSQGKNEGQFSVLQAIGIDGAGQIYVLDQNNYIQKFDPDGRFVAKWLNPNDLETFDMSVNQTGNIYLAGTRQNSATIVREFDYNGQLLNEWQVILSAKEAEGTPPDFQRTILDTELDEQGKLYRVIGLSRPLLHNLYLETYDTNGNLANKTIFSNNVTIRFFQWLGYIVILFGILIGLIIGLFVRRR